MSLSLHRIGKCMPLSVRLEAQMSSMTRKFHNLSKSNIHKFGLVGTASALMLFKMSSADCAADSKPEQKPTSVLKPAGVPSRSPDADPVEEFINQYGPSLQRLGFGGFMGICTGVAFKRLGNQVAYVLGLGFIAIQGLSYMGYVRIDYAKVTEDAKKVVDLDGDGKLTSKDLAVFWRNLKDILTYNLPSMGGFSTGLALGIYFGN